ncbi:hypothetical protein ACFC1R_07800, partial [Kitasatospora sp. NPDC056138]|uniref:hypothetical protein n=1 Tax=Kitasatospora sp. NPDC056138 TaxID=3345724 RepID=UPI0035DD186D
SFRPPSSGPSGRFVLSCFQLIRCFPLRFPEFHSPDPLSFGLSAIQTLSDRSDRLSRFPGFQETFAEPT